VTALVFRSDPNDPAVVVDEDDGCETGNHRRDELCARTRLEALPPLDQADGERGGAT
jgi:hypothetical protein